MPPLREILVKQAGVLGNLEENLPAGAPRVSQLMDSIAGTLPVNPHLPELPGAPGTTSPFSKATASIIRGLEEPGTAEIEVGKISPPEVPSKPLGEEIYS